MILTRIRAQELELFLLFHGIHAAIDVLTVADKVVAFHKAEFFTWVLMRGNGLCAFTQNALAVLGNNLREVLCILL